MQYTKLALRLKGKDGDRMAVRRDYVLVTERFTHNDERMVYIVQNVYIRWLTGYFALLEDLAT
jgi:hypothetical protein